MLNANNDANFVTKWKIPLPIAIFQVPSWPQLKIHALGEILLMCRETKDMEEIAHR